MRIRVFLLVVATTLLAPAAVASAKGPVGATVDGDGLAAPVELRLEDRWELVEDLGFFAAVFRTEPDPMQAAPPAGDLGPRLVVAWEVPGPSGPPAVVRQDVYPFAAAGPLTYMAPGQAVVGTTTYGGWFRAPAGLADDLVAAGIPISRPVAAEAAATRQEDAGHTGRAGVAWPAVALVGLAGVGAAGLGLAAVRRSRVRDAAGTGAPAA
jgi:hypothetical protein